jgi:hypothetical protein
MSKCNHHRVSERYANNELIATCVKGTKYVYCTQCYTWVPVDQLQKPRNHGHNSDK